MHMQEWFDTSMTVTPIIVSVDIAIISNLQALLRLIAYHGQTG